MMCAQGNLGARLASSTLVSKAQTEIMPAVMQTPRAPATELRKRVAANPDEDSEFSWEVHCITSTISGAEDDTRLLNPLVLLFGTARPSGAIRVQADMHYDSLFEPITHC